MISTVLASCWKSLLGKLPGLLLQLTPRRAPAGRTSPESPSRESAGKSGSSIINLGFREVSVQGRGGSARTPVLTRTSGTLATSHPCGLKGRMGLQEGARRVKCFQAQTPALLRRKIWVKFGDLFSVKQVTGRKGELPVGSEPASTGGTVGGGRVPLVGFHLSCLHLPTSVPGELCIRGRNIIWGISPSPHGKH